MTQESRVFVSPSDIVSIGYECPHCKSTFSVPLGKVDRVSVLCGNCQERIVKETPESSSHQSEFSVFNQFVMALRSLQAREFGKNIRMEILGESK